MADVVAGKVDVVIGTHRLLGRDMAFKDLGLLVVDEEQRFGVAHKERLKQFRASVDVLTMTATPIPRTLEMALTGIREMSTIDTPPEDRQPVLTYVGAYDEGLALGAVRRELLREGQVFWVHNRVATIDRQAAWLARAAAGGAHRRGATARWTRTILERQMVRFWDREADVLVCTTIIESGLDVPNANTLIVDRADLMGLAQMYQLRGRVGRSAERAFAYFFFAPQREMTDEARERLATISTHQALGSGFQIALRDLEIRGAGNVLGAEQHGHIAAVGFDAYARILQESMAEMKGEAIPVETELRIDLPRQGVHPAGLGGAGVAAPGAVPADLPGGRPRRAGADPRRDRRPLRRPARSGGDAVRGRVAARDLPRAGRRGGQHLPRSGAPDARRHPRRAACRSAGARLRGHLPRGERRR